MSRLPAIRDRYRGSKPWSVPSRHEARVRVPGRAMIAAAAAGAITACLFAAVQTGAVTALIGWVGQFDRTALATMNGYARHSRAFDTLIWAIASNYAVQGGLMLAMFWWAWFAAPDTPDGLAQRQTMLSSFLGLYVAVVLALMVRDGLAFRPRPAEDPLTAFLMPYLPAGVTLSRETSSFPSGHATVFFALAAGLWWLSPRLGIIGALHAFFIGCLPRMYLGFHYPSDIVAGAVLGAGTVCVVNSVIRCERWTARLVSLSRERAALFYSILLLISVETATEFTSVRMLLKLMASSHFHRIVMH